MQLSKEMFNPDVLTAEDMLAFIKRYKDDPVLFSIEILGLTPDKNQIAILEAIRDNDYTSVSAGRGIGKTITIAMASSWSIATQGGAKVMVSSNTDAQSKATLWAPLCSIIRKSLIGDWFEYTTELVHFKGDRDTAFIKRLVWSEHNIEAVSGYHAKNMLYCLDEASKFPNALIENLYASCTEENNKILLTSNPTKNSGYFYDTQERKLWKFMEIDSRSSVHTDKRKIQDLIDEFGMDSDVVRVQVLGKFPRYSTSSIISPDVIERSLAASKPNIQTNHVRVLGWDIAAEGGDANAFVVRYGPWLEHVEKVYAVDDDPEPLVQKIVELVKKYDIERIRFDKTGIGHRAKYLLKHRVPEHVDIVGVNFGAGSPDPDCVNSRDWIYKRLRDWFGAGGLLGPKKQFRDTLLATEYSRDVQGRLKLIPKKVIKSNLSEEECDICDALALTCGYSGNLMFGAPRKLFKNNNLAQMMMDAGNWEGS
jgi:hypothetical protein